MTVEAAKPRLRQAFRRKGPSHADRILTFLRECGTPRTAYQILDTLKDEGIAAPPTVYRALGHLLAANTVHRVEATNAYVACRHGICRGPAVIAVCVDCGAVTERSEEEFNAELSSLLSGLDFDPASATIEVRGRCGSCA